MGAPSRAPSHRRVATPTFAPIPRPATCDRDRATARRRACASRCIDRRLMNPRNAAEGIQPSATCAKSLGNARCATPQPTHSQETRKQTGHINPPRTPRMAGRRPDGHAVQLSTGQSRPESTRSSTNATRISPNRPTARLQARARPPQTRGSALLRPKRPYARRCAFVFYPPPATNDEAWRGTPIPRTPSTNNDNP